MSFEGYAAGPHVSSGGSGSNFLCLPGDPQWETYIDGDQTSGSISGVEYELYNSGTHHNNVFDESNNGGSPLSQKPAPCAVCYVEDRSSAVMIPARTQCPDGWTMEYGGYIVAEYHATGRKRSSYICWDKAPEAYAGDGRSYDQSFVYPVEVQCGTLPCSLYPNGRELTCVVCSK